MSIKLGLGDWTPPARPRCIMHYEVDCPTCLLGGTPPPAIVVPTPPLQQALDEVAAEIAQASKNWPPSHNAHEGYAVLLEEVDELWDCVRTKQKNRDLAKMRKEAIQVAAMAVRFAIEVCDEVSGRR